jgi:hypothetical protein
VFLYLRTCSIRVGELLQPLDSPLRPRTVKSFRASHNAVVYMLLVASFLYVASAHPMKHEPEVAVRVLRNFSRKMHDCPYISRTPCYASNGGACRRLRVVKFISLVTLVLDSGDTSLVVLAVSPWLWFTAVSS